MAFGTFQLDRPTPQAGKPSICVRLGGVGGGLGQNLHSDGKAREGGACVAGDPVVHSL